jgi:single stranded DNA-binding protein (ssb)
MINKVFLLGNLGSDPQIKFTKDGVMMAIFRMATNEFIRRNGTYEKITDWHTVRAFGKLADFCSKLKKGDRIFVEGKLRSTSFESDNKLYRVSMVIAKSIKVIPRGSAKDEFVEYSDEQFQMDISENFLLPANGQSSNNGNIDFDEEDNLF